MIKSVSGVWYNEFGSKVILEINGASVSGSYFRDSEAESTAYHINGALDPFPSENGRAIGFVVTWVNRFENANSVTAWSGQYEMIDGQEYIFTQWLLTQAPVDGENWSSPLSSQATFTREQPMPEVIARRLKRGPVPHPLRQQ